MTMARSQIVDVSVTRWYHCMTRCVRRAFLLSEDEGEGAFDRKAWIEDRIEELAQIVDRLLGDHAVWRRLVAFVRSQGILNWISRDATRLRIRSPETVLASVAANTQYTVLTEPSYQFDKLPVLAREELRIAELRRFVAQPGEVLGNVAAGWLADGEGDG